MHEVPQPIDNPGVGLTRREFTRDLAAASSLALPKVREVALELTKGAGLMMFRWLMAPSPAMAAAGYWSDKYWFPIGEDTANGRGIHRLDTALAVYDAIAGTNFVSDQRKFMEWYIENRSGTLASAGYCHGLGHSGLKEVQPSGGDKMFAGVRVTYETRVGLLVALHSGDAMYRPTGKKGNIQANFDALVDEFNQTGESFVVDLPDKLDKLQSSGSWYRVYVGGGLFTNFGASPRTFNREWLQDAYRPYKDNEIDPNWNQSQIEYIPDSWKNNPQNNWKFDLDEDLVRQIAA